jgi:integrase
MPTFMAVGKVRAILREAEEHHPEIVARLAIGFFAGLRSCELDRLTWESVKWDDGIITVLHTKTSSGHLQSIPRHVNISDNLRTWLQHYRGEGAIGPTGKRLTSTRKALASAVSERWEENACRHTFATMHMAKHRDSDRLATEMGHMQGVRVLFRHYRGLAPASDAETFWSLLPTKALSMAVAVA